MDIELIRDIAYAPIHKVTDFRQQGDKVSVTAQWTNIPMKVSSGTMGYFTRSNTPGVYAVIDVSARLNTRIADPTRCLIKITLCSGISVIIGTPHVPVLPEIRESLTSITFQISHNSMTKPLELLL